MEAVCEEALRKENGGMIPAHTMVPAVDIIKPSVPVLTHSASDDISSGSDDCLSQTSDMHGGKDLDSGLGSIRGKTPNISLSSVTSGSMDADDSDIYGELFSVIFKEEN